MTAKPELLLLAPIDAPTIAELEREFTIHRLWTAPHPDVRLKELAHSVRGMVTPGLHGYTRGHIETLAQLEIIAVFGVGHGVLDLAAAKERGVLVVNTPAGTAASVADLTIGLILALMRQIGASDRFVRAGKWPAGPAALGVELGGKTCGIVGLGAIGKAVAKRAEVFGMSVCYHGPGMKPEVTYPYYPELKAMAQAADCLVVACPATPQTIDLIDAPILEALGPQGFLVNVGRGPIVNERALIAALTAHRIAGAALDVFWDEPRLPAELLTLENVVLTPHIGTATHEIRAARSAALVANLRAHFSGQEVRTRVV